MNKPLIRKAEFLALIADAKRSDAAKEKLWFGISDRILADWDGVSYKFLDSLTPGQSALVCCAQFSRQAKYDFLTSITSSELPSRALRAFSVIGADEYLELLRQIEAVFPRGKFPEFAEDMVTGLWKQPDGYFEKATAKFVTGTGMKRLLRDYVFDYVTAHPEDFSI